MRRVYRCKIDSIMSEEPITSPWYASITEAEKHIPEFRAFANGQYNFMRDDCGRLYDKVEPVIESLEISDSYSPMQDENFIQMVHYPKKEDFIFDRDKVSFLLTKNNLDKERFYAAAYAGILVQIDGKMMQYDRDDIFAYVDNKYSFHSRREFLNDLRRILPDECVHHYKVDEENPIPEPSVTILELDHKTINAIRENRDMFIIPKDVVSSLIKELESDEYYQKHLKDKTFLPELEEVMDFLKGESASVSRQTINSHSDEDGRNGTD